MFDSAPENDVITIDNTLPSTRVSIDGGAGDDRFNFVRAGLLDTKIIGGDDNDAISVSIEGFPQNRQFTNLSLAAESLIIDNSTNTLPVAWTHRNGVIEARAIPSTGPAVQVIGTDGVDRTRIIGGTADDTLDIISETGNDIPGFIENDLVELTTGLQVVVAQGRPVTTIQNYDGVIAFDLTPAGKNYEEEGFVFATEPPLAVAGFDESTPRRGENFRIDQTGTRRRPSAISST